jgi:hypothetical protein
VDLHTDKKYPGKPPFYLDHVGWNFDGKNDNEKPDKNPMDVRLCPYDSFAVCTLAIRCPQCEKYVTDNTEEKIIESIPLQERIADAVPHIITIGEKREYQDAVIQCVRDARDADDATAYDAAVKKLCDIAEKLNYRTMWIYWQLTSERHMVNVRALHSIGRVKGYKPFWAKMEAKRIGRMKWKDAENVQQSC